MPQIDEAEFQQAQEASERRRLAALERRRKQTQRTIIGAVAVFIVLPVSLFLGVGASRAPQPPNLVVTWPKDKVPQVMADGQTLLLRPGQPVTVTITDPTNWKVSWASAEVGSPSSALTWAPTQDKAELVASCQPVASGIWRLASVFWPRPSLRLKSVAPVESGAYVRSLPAGTSGVWLAPHIYAPGPAAWDERSLALVARLNQELPEKAAVEAGQAPASPFWEIVGNFAGESSTAATDGATYARLNVKKDVDALMPRLGTEILRQKPDVSLKFIMRLDKDPQEGIFRLAFDGKRERRAWVKYSGEAAGTEVQGWPDGENPGNLAPVLPRRTGLTPGENEASAVARAAAGTTVAQPVSAEAPANTANATAAPVGASETSPAQTGASATDAAETAPDAPPASR